MNITIYGDPVAMATWLRQMADRVENGDDAGVMIESNDQSQPALSLNFYAEPDSDFLYEAD